MNKMSNMTKKQSGFTLIEIAIVLVIIGLLLGGVLQGQQLIENSRVRNAVNGINGTAAAAFAYVDRYGRFPGDDAGALPARGASWPANAAGNSDGALAGTTANTFAGVSEVGFFWQNLRSGGFVAGNPATTLAQALPSNAFGGLIGVSGVNMMSGGTPTATPLAGNKVCLSQVPGTAAIALDTQLDDGASATGRFRASAGASGANTTPNGTAVATYSEDLIYTVCYRI